MWKLNHRRHCSDDLLIAHADGELAGRDKRRVPEHLAECWECRARLEQLETTARTLARMSAEAPFGGAQRAAAAKASFLVWRTEFEREHSSRRPAWPRWRMLPAQAWATLAALLVVGAAFWMEQNWKRPRPMETLEKARRAEQSLFSQPAVVHQVMNIEVIEAAPQPKRGGGRLEVWAQHGQRYSARWTDLRGELKYAVWHPSPEQSWRYDSGVARHALPVKHQETTDVSLVEMRAGRFESLEAAVLDWVRNRTWKPVEVAGDFARFASSGGLSLDAHRGRASDGQETLRLTAHKAGTGMSVDFTLELDADSYHPRLQQVTYRVGERVLVVRVDVAKEVPLPPAQVAPGIFGPDAALLVSLPRVSPRPPAPVLPAPPALASLDVLESPEAELERMSTAHLLGACIPPRPPTVVGGPGLDAALRRQVERRLAGLSSPLTVDSIAAETLSLATTALDEATELQRLAEWSASQQAGQLDARHWSMLDRMIQDHVARLRSKLARARGLLEPLLAGSSDGAYLVSPHGQRRSDETWPSDVAHVRSHLKRFEQRARDLFAPARQARVNPHLAISEILMDLPTAEQELGWLQTEWNRAVQARAGRAF